MTFIQKMRTLFKLAITVDAQAQTALKRKWAQWKSGWGGTPFTSNHFNYHSSSITETSRATISLEPPAAAVSSGHKENSHFLSKAETNANGQQKKSQTCINGEVDMLNKMETSII